MEIWQYLQILREPKKSWFYSKTDIDRKLDAMTGIALQGHLRDIQHLMPFLKDKHKAMREAACNAILYLFKKVATKNAYYDALKHCAIAPADIDYYASAFPGEAYFQLLAICSLNGNGYVREKAVKLLLATNDPKAIPFVVYRLADWVPAVRMAARQSIVHFKQPAFINALIENLAVFEWLQRVARASLQEIHQEIIDYLVKENRRLIIGSFYRYPDRIRVLLARHISKSLTDDPNEISTFLSDKHFLVRLQAVEHFDRLSPAAIDQLLNDKSPRVRLRALYRLKGRDNFLETASRFLADNSGDIRYFTRHWLRDTITDFSAIYHQHILNKQQVIASITGLAEMNAKSYSTVIAGFLYNKHIKIRRAALLALTKLDREAAYQFALDNMDSEIGLRKEIVEFLAHMPTKEVLAKARTCFQHGSDEMKQSMISLFAKIGGWAVISDLVLGLLDNNEQTKQLSYDKIKRWLINTRGIFIGPEQADIDRTNRIIQFAAEILKEKDSYYNRHYYGEVLNEVAFMLRW
jgi:HEAT repeat protein